LIFSGMKDKRMQKIVPELSFIFIVGIIGNTLELGPPTGLYPDIWGKIDPVLIGIGGVFLMIWYTLIVVKLFNLASQKQRPA
jgi:hypothetical protein